jgi:hypothetical protein
MKFGDFSGWWFVYARDLVATLGLTMVQSVGAKRVLLTRSAPARLLSPTTAIGLCHTQNTLLGAPTIPLPAKDLPISTSRQNSERRKHKPI